MWRVWGGNGIQEVFVLCTPFFRKPKTALENGLLIFFYLVLE